MSSLRIALLLLLATSVLGLGACQSEPYCLNCTSTDLAPTRLDISDPPDGTVRPDLSDVDLTVLPDLSQCVASNGGVEVCDGIDNDCNGTVDDVDSAKLVADPQNCGACGNKCNFLALHMFGACDATSGTPMCNATTCLPGYYDFDATVAGCEYQCVPTGAEVCDGQDNDCNGIIDDGFGYPNYATDANNCGGCGTSCGLPGAVTACQAGVGGKGACVVTSCLNTPGTVTYRHNPANGSIDSTGCEYRCPVPSSISGDCNAMSCSFPAEACNGLDDDCDFLVDDAPTDVGIGFPCYDTCPGGEPLNCGGVTECKPGTLSCSNGGRVCGGGVGPSAELCDGKDNNCDGQIDEPFGYPLYNTDPNNCGGCFAAGNAATAAFKCDYLQNAVTGCHTDASVQPQGTSAGVCYVVACNESATGGYRYRAATCGGSGAPKDGPSGVGCQYACPSWPLRPETCNGADDDCDGCIDEALTPPAICSALGACNTNTDCTTPCTAGTCQTATGVTQACGGSRFTPSCTGATGWVCDYRGDSVVDADPTTGGLAATESKCDQRDNNCNNIVDTDGFGLVSYTSPVACTDTQLGLCRRSGTYVCGTPGAPAAPSCLLTSPVVAAATEVCDGLDNDCDGLVDETKANPGTASYVVEDMVQLTRPDPADVNLTLTYWMYRYEATRPDATSLAVGVSTARACGKALARPWSTVTQVEAQAACTAAGLRLCNEEEWIRGCAGAAGNDFPYGNVYDGNRCNGRDWNPACGGADDFEQAQPTGTPYGCPLPGSSQCASADGLVDMSGNVKEWTSTLASNGTSYVVHGGAYDNVEDGLSCGFDFVALPPTTKLATVGFRCCADVAP